MIKLGADLRVNFRYLIQNVAKKGKLALTIVRRRAKLCRYSCRLGDRPALIPSLNGEYPPYFVYGPLVFSKATLNTSAPQ